MCSVQTAVRANQCCIRTVGFDSDGYFDMNCDFLSGNLYMVFKLKSHQFVDSRFLENWKTQPELPLHTRLLRT